MVETLARLCHNYSKRFDLTGNDARHHNKKQPRNTMTPPDQHSANEPLAYAAPVSGEPIIIPDTSVVPEPGQTGDPAPPVSRPRAWVVLIALTVAAFFVVSNEIAIMGLLGPIADDLGRDESEIGIAATVFAIAVMITTLPLTLLTTKFVRRWVIVSALGLFTIGALVGATADTFTQLLVSRGITGASHALFWAVVTPATAGMFPKAERGKAVARLMLGAAAAGVIGLPAETWLGQNVGWHAPFWVLTGGGALIAVTIAVLMPSFRTQQSTLIKGEYPSVKRFWRVMGVTALSTGAMTLSWTFFAPLATDRYGFDEGTVPMLMVVSGASGVVTTWFIARYLDRYPVKTVVIGEGLLLTLFLGLTFLGTSQPVFIAMLLLQGLAWSTLVAAMINWALRHTPYTSDIGNATYAVLFNTGNAIGSRVGVAVVAAGSVDWLPVISAVLVAGALALAATTPRTRLPRAPRSARRLTTAA